jgi:hypothetical protein
MVSASSSKFNSDKKTLSILEIGSLVRMRDHALKCWNKLGTINSIRRNGRSYYVECDGKYYLRNRCDLKPASFIHNKTEELPDAPDKPNMPRRSQRLKKRFC